MEFCTHTSQYNEKPNRSTLASKHKQGDTMTQHTPGPWRVAIGSAKTVIAPHVLANRRTNVVVEAKTEGDARLIAIAPAMLKVLRAIVEDLSTRGDETREQLLAFVWDGYEHASAVLAEIDKEV